MATGTPPKFVKPLRHISKRDRKRFPSHFLKVIAWTIVELQRRVSLLPTKWRPRPEIILLAQYMSISVQWTDYVPCVAYIKKSSEMLEFTNSGHSCMIHHMFFCISGPCCTCTVTVIDPSSFYDNNVVSQRHLAPHGYLILVPKNLSEGPLSQNCLSP